nr:hypothetical protein [Tanacetum cinerariifolium]
MGYCSRKVGNGENTRFWEDVWMGDSSLKCQFPRLYVLDTRKEISVADKLRHESFVFSFRHVSRGGIEAGQYDELSSRLDSIRLVQMNDRWVWSLTGSCDFSVKSVRNLLDDSLLSSNSLPTRWVKKLGNSNGNINGKSFNGNVEAQRELQAKIENVVLSDQGDTWKWSLGNASCFSVASVRYLIGSKTLDTSPIATRWLRSIPIKVNIFI